MKKAFTLLRRVNFKTVVFNLKYFPFKTAVKLPVLLSGNVFLHKTKGRIIINGPIKTGMIQIGYAEVALSDFKRSRAIWEVHGDVIFNGKTFITHGCKINVMENAQLIFGDNVVISTETSIVVQKKIEIGNNSGISWECLVMDTDFHPIYDSDNNIINPAKEILIGDNVWVGCRCTVLKGTIIPNGSIIAASSMVNKSLSGDNCIFGGQPTRVLKSDIHWHF